MPNDNKQQSSNSLDPQTNSVMPPIVMEDAVPPMIQMDNQSFPQTTNEQPPVVAEDVKNEPPAENIVTNTPSTTPDSGSAAPMNDVVDTVMPAVVTSGPRKKFAGGRVIATILGLFLLVGGIGAGVFLTEQNQNIQEKADSCSTACAPGPGTGPGTAACNACNNANTPTACPCGFNGSGTCRSCPSENNNPDPAPTITCSAGERVCNGVCTNTNTNERCGSCTVGCSQGFACLNGTCVSGEGRSCASPGDCPIGYRCNANTLKCAPESTFTTSTGTCITDANCDVGNQCINGVCINPSLNCKGSDSGAPGCCQVTSDADCNKIGSVVCEPGAQGDRVECKVGVQHCTLRVGTGQCGGGNNNTNTPTPPAITAKCQNITAYSETWTALTAANLSSLKAGDKVNFCVVGSATGGSFTKAKLTINSVAQAETSTKRPSSNDFCQLYTIPAATNTFNISAQINHSTLGWK